MSMEIVIGALIAGFCTGYLARATISWRRRERVRQRSWACMGVLGPGLDGARGTVEGMDQLGRAGARQPVRPLVSLANLQILRARRNSWASA